MFNGFPAGLACAKTPGAASRLAAGSGGYEIDAPGIQAATEEAQSRLKGVNRIRKSLTNITTSAEKAREEVDGMVGDVETCLSRVESLIEVAGAEDGAA